MTGLDDALLAVLRRATSVADLSYEVAPRPLTGGFWAQLRAFRLSGAPAGWDGDLVARIMPDAGIAAKEIAVQTEVAAQGYATPSVHLADATGAGLGSAYMVMDLAPGAPPLGSLRGREALVALPRLARSLPELLADSLGQLHRLDPGPVRARLAAGGVEGATLCAAIAGMHERAQRAGRRDLTRAAEWLIDHAPPSGPDVICHGDLHPFNLLVDSGGGAHVIDWSASLLGPAEYDIAFTGLLLAEPPVEAPAALRAALRMAGRQLARRFRRCYAQRSGATLDMASISWHEGVVCLRALVDVAGWEADGGIEQRRGHPWLLNRSAFAARLAAGTGMVHRRWSGNVTSSPGSEAPS